MNNVHTLRISEAANVWNPALHTLKEMGYELSAVSYDEMYWEWKATKGNKEKCFLY